MKKMSRKTERLLICIVVALLCIAIGGAVYLVLDSTGTFDEPEVTTIAPETTLPVAQIEHEDVETQLNDDGTLKKIIYYKDNVYDGSVDFVYKGDTVYEVHFDADNEYVQSIKRQINEKGSVIYESIGDQDKMHLITEFVYYDDGVTLWKKTMAEQNDEGVEVITKLLYTESGLVTDKYIYEDSVEVSHTVYTYDENGELIGEEEVTE